VPGGGTQNGPSEAAGVPKKVFLKTFSRTEADSTERAPKRSDARPEACAPERTGDTAKKKKLLKVIPNLTVRL